MAIAQILDLPDSQEPTRLILLRRLCAAGRASEINLGTGYRRFGRRVALGAVLAAFLAGCGGQSETVTGDPSAPSLTAAPSTAAAVSPVWGPVTARVMQSVLPVFASDQNAADGFVGTGFRGARRSRMLGANSADGGT